MTKRRIWKRWVTLMSTLSFVASAAGGQPPQGQPQQTGPGGVAAAEFQPPAPPTTSVTSWKWNGASSVTSGTPLWLTITYTATGKTFAGYIRPTNTGSTFTA